MIDFAIPLRQRADMATEPPSDPASEALSAEATVELLHKAKLGDESALDRLLQRCMHPRASPLGARTISIGKGVGVSLGFVIMPKGFDDIDFGARPGTFHTDKEVLSTATSRSISRGSSSTSSN